MWIIECRVSKLNQNLEYKTYLLENKNPLWLREMLFAFQSKHMIPKFLCLSKNEMKDSEPIRKKLPEYVLSWQYSLMTVSAYPIHVF